MGSKDAHTELRLAGDLSDPLLRRIDVFRGSELVRQAPISGIQGAKTIRACCIALLWAKFRSQQKAFGPAWCRLAEDAPRMSWAATLVENLGEDKDPAWWKRVRENFKNLKDIGANDTPFRLSESHGKFRISYIPESHDAEGCWAIARLRLFRGETEITGLGLIELAKKIESVEVTWVNGLIPDNRSTGDAASTSPHESIELRSPGGVQTTRCQAEMPLISELLAFAERVQQFYQGADCPNAELKDPRQIYLPLPCRSPSGPERCADAIQWVVGRLEDGRGQLLLANYGMGKSYLALKLFWNLVESYAAGTSLRLPIFFPLKRLRSLVRDSLHLFFDNITEFLQMQGFGMSSAVKDQLAQLQTEGRLVFVLDGLDEIPYLHLYNGRDLIELLAAIRFGSNPWVCTGRTGLFASSLWNHPRHDAFAVTLIDNWSPQTWRTYVGECHKNTRLFGNLDDVQLFLDTVQRFGSLRDLTNTPLFARMLVESWKEIILDPKDMNEAQLYSTYCRSVFKAKSDVSHAVQREEDKFQCLEGFASYLVRSGRRSCSIDDLPGVVDKYVLGLSSQDLKRYVATELQIYSLVAVNEPLTLSFSHQSLEEFFHALAVLRQRAWSVHDGIFERELPQLAAKFLGQLLKTPGYELQNRLFLEEVRKSSPARSSVFRRNLFLIAVATGSECNSTDWSDITLSGICLSELGTGSLTGVCLNSCRATNVDFSGLDMSGAKFRNANLVGCSFKDTILRGADLSGCTFVEVPELQDVPKLGDAKLDKIHLDEASYRHLAAAVELETECKPGWREKARASLEEANSRIRSRL